MKKYLLILSTLFLCLQCAEENQPKSSVISVSKYYKASRTSWMTYSNDMEGNSSQERIYSNNLPEYNGDIRFVLYKDAKHLIEFGWDLEISQIVLQGDTVWVVTNVMANPQFVSISLDLYQSADIIYKKTPDSFCIELVLKSYVCTSKNNDGTVVSSKPGHVGPDAHYDVNNWLKGSLGQSDTLNVHLSSTLEPPRDNLYFLVEKHIFIEPHHGQLTLDEHNLFENKTQAFFEENFNGPGTYAIKEVFSYPNSLDLKEKPVHESIPYYSSDTYSREFSELMDPIEKNMFSFAGDQHRLIQSDFSEDRIQRVKEWTKMTLKAAIYGHHSGGQMGMVICAAAANLTEKEAFPQPSHTGECTNPTNLQERIGETIVALTDLALRDLNGIAQENWNTVFTNGSFDYAEFYKNGVAQCHANAITSGDEKPTYSYDTLKSNLDQTLNNTEISLVDAVNSFYELGMINKPERRVLVSYFDAFEAARDSEAFSQYSQATEEVIENAIILPKASKELIASLMSIARHSLCYWNQVLEGEEG